MKNKAFSLIEIVISVAIMTIISGVVGIQFRDYIAKTKNARVLLNLNSFRSAANLYMIENSESLFSENLNTYDKEKTKEALKKLEVYLNKNSIPIINSGEMEIGGSKDSTNGEKKYGGKVRLTFIKPNGAIDNSIIWIEPIDNTGEYNFKGEKWIDF